MPPTISREPYVKQSISLRRDQLAAAKHVVREDGHGNLSRLVQDLVESELRRRYGRDWGREVAVSTQTAQTGAG